MTETGKRYGTSLYELAAEEGLTERILAELDVAMERTNAGATLSALVDDAQCPPPKKRALCVAGPGVCAGASVSCNLLKDFVPKQAFCQNCLPAQQTYRDRFQSRTITFLKFGSICCSLDEKARSRLQERKNCSG